MFSLCIFKMNSKDTSFQLFKHFQADIKPWIITYLCILIICLYNSKEERHLCLMCVWFGLECSSHVGVTRTSFSHINENINSLTHVHWLPTLKNTPKTVFIWSALLKTWTVTTVEVGLICHYCQFRLTGIFLLRKVYEYKLKFVEQLNTIRTLRLSDCFLEVLETKAANPTKNLLFFHNTIQVMILSV